jgi:hypothetical protein
VSGLTLSQSYRQQRLSGGDWVMLLDRPFSAGIFALGGALGVWTMLSALSRQRKDKLRLKTFRFDLFI